MTDDTSDEPLFVIKDRVNGRYLTGWKGPEKAPTSFHWDTDIANAHQLLKGQAHTIRAGVLAVSVLNGGLPETHAVILSHEMEAAAALRAKQLGGQSAAAGFVIRHPAEGYFVKHTVDGDKVTVFWNKNVNTCKPMTREQAEALKEYAGLPMCFVDPLPATYMPPSLGSAASPVPPTPPGNILQQAQQPRPITRRVAILEERDLAALTDLVNKALAEGAQLAGGAFAHGDVVCWPIIWVTQAPAPAAPTSAKG